MKDYKENQIDATFTMRCFLYNVLRGDDYFDMTNNIQTMMRGHTGLVLDQMRHNEQSQRRWDDINKDWW